MTDKKIEEMERIKELEAEVERLKGENLKLKEQSEAFLNAHYRNHPNME